MLPAQNRNPSGLPGIRFYQAFPSGGKVGSSFEVTVSGKHFDDIKTLVFSNPNLKAELLPAPVPEIDPKTKKPKAGMPVTPPDTVKFKVTIPAGTPLGQVDVRVQGKYGTSNPRVFVVGDLEEVLEKEPNNDVDQAQKVALNCTINGTSLSGTDVDYYVFSAKKGQRVVLSCLASSIDSRFQPLLEVYDKEDRQLCSNRNYNGADALTDFVVPEDGDYHVRCFQFTHTARTAIPGGLTAGSSDSWYRLSISTAPWIDSVVPPTLEPGKPTPVTVFGRNLPEGKLDPLAKTEDGPLEKITMTVTALADGVGKMTFTGHVPAHAALLDGFELRVRNAVGSSNAFLLGIAKAPVIVDNGDNDTVAKAQAVALPCEIGGAIEKRQDRDWYKFTAKKGEIYNVEVLSNRLGAPAFMMIQLQRTDSAAGKTNTAVLHKSPLNEPTPSLSPKFVDRTEDPRMFRFVVPTDGEYQLLVMSRAGDTLFGPRHSYAVRIIKEAPDFRVAAMSWAESYPDVTTIPAGGQDAFSVVVYRTGEFAGDVELTIEGLPAGVSCPPQTLGAGTRKTTMVLTAAPGIPAWTGQVKIKATATINGAKVVREARPATITWPTQTDGGTSISRLDHSLWLSVNEKVAYTLSPSIDKAEIVQGDKANAKVKVNRVWPDLKQPIQVTLMQGQNNQGAELPQNLRFNNNQPLTIAPGAADVAVPVTVAADVPPGVYNVVFRGQTQVPYSKDPMAKTKPNTFIVTPSEPLTVVVLPKTLATMSVPTPNPTVKIGQQLDFPVRLNRQFKYDGEFKVQLVLPAGVTGVEAAEVTVPSGGDEAKFVLKVPPTAAPGSRGNIVVKATAIYRGKPIVHETKINVNVVK
jgi:hypothetical protein